MDSIFDTPTPRVVREEHLASLSPPGRRIAETIVAISRASWASSWHRHAEHRIWRAIHELGRDRESLGLDVDACAELRRLADAAGGWVAWTSRPKLVEMPGWLVLHRAWVRRHPE